MPEPVSHAITSESWIAIPKLDHEAWGRLSRRDRAAVTAGLVENDARLKNAIRREARHSGAAPLVQLAPDTETLAKTIATLHSAAIVPWQRVAALSALATLIAVAVVWMVTSNLAVSASLTVAAIIAYCAVVAVLRQRAESAITPVIVETQGRIAIIDAQAVSLYTVTAGEPEARMKRWPLATLRAASYGWPGLPGLMLATSSRKIHLPFGLHLDGSGSTPLPIEQVDILLSGVFGERYAGTTLPGNPAMTASTAA